MAIEIISEVYKYAPQDIKGTELLVLLRLAESANVSTRTTWIGADRIAREIHCGRSSVFAALKRLKERGLIRDVLKEHESPDKTGSSTTRYITPWRTWGAQDADGSVPEGPDLGLVDIQEGPDQGLVDIMAPTCEDGDESRIATSPGSGPEPSRDIYLAKSYIPSGYNSVAPGKPTRRSKPQRRSKKFKALDEFDPAEFLEVHDHQPDDHEPESAAESLIPEDRFRSEDRKEPQAPGKKRREPGPDTGMGLANYFSQKMEEAVGGNAWLSIQNRTKLAKSLNEWKRLGCEPALIRQMIDLYTTLPGVRLNNYTAWRDFLAKKEFLASRVQQVRRKSGEMVSSRSTEVPYLRPDGTIDKAAYTDYMINLRMRRKR